MLISAVKFKILVIWYQSFLRHFCTCFGSHFYSIWKLHLLFYYCSGDIMQAVL